MPRPYSRSSGALISISTSTYPCSLSNVTKYGPTDTVYESAVQSSVRTPGFRLLKRSQLPVNTYSTAIYRRVYTPSFSRKDTVSPNGTVLRIETRDGFPGLWYPDVYVGESLAQLRSSDANAAKAAAVNRLLANLKDMKFNAAQAFAERRQTANLLMNSVNRLVEFTRNFRRGNLSRCLSLLKSWKKARSNGREWSDKRWRNLKIPTQSDFGRLWLEYSYGWKPLLGDIHGAAELLAQTYYRETQPTRSDGKAKFRSETPFQSGICSGFTQVKFDVRYSVFYRIDNPATVAGSQTGLLDPALLAWELIPFSFVVDWLLPVGDYLEGINAPAGLVFVKGQVSERSTLHAFGALSGTDPSGWKVSGGSYDYFQYAQSRTRLESFPSPMTPTASLELNLNRFFSAFALMDQIFNPGVKSRNRGLRSSSLT